MTRPTNASCGSLKVLAEVETIETKRIVFFRACMFALVLNVCVSQFVLALLRIPCIWTYIDHSNPLYSFKLLAIGFKLLVANNSNQVYSLLLCVTNVLATPFPPNITINEVKLSDWELARSCRTTSWHALCNYKRFFFKCVQSAESGDVDV